MSVTSSGERQSLGLLHAATARSLDPPGRGQPDDRAAAEVGDQQGDRLRVDHLAEGCRDGFDGIDRGAGLDPLQKCADVDHGPLRPAHVEDPRRMRVSAAGVNVATRNAAGPPHGGGPAAPVET
jgi:hypothetical protein